MTKNLAITLALIATSALVLGAFIVLAGRSAPPGDAAGAGAAPASTAPEELLVREDSHHLTEAPDAEVTVVEFLDFECEACLAQFPVMERLREDYDGRINLVIRYFPMPGHTNSETAATAVEAAARQGELEAMYIKMYETQEEWGESDESKAAEFAGFAEDLGLDTEQFAEDVADPATLDRVRADFEDGRALGVQGTPTIFVNGRQTDPMPSYATLSSMIDRELS
ncbi:DsbA family protein [Nocardiopsis sediminis]|uniref:DsbA family protein n=1 Tax=Nocardiopsis sediminis TaxID=1778267 RepID=A0ABV8FMB9_9ACTN